MSVTDIKNQLDVITEAELAKLRNVGLRHLRNERSRGNGPPFTQIGQAVFYPKKGLREYLAEHTVTPSQAGTLINGRGKNGRSGKKQIASTP